ncbi:helix-turn-helix transcriptional regulator [Mycobacteroides chelonae]|jgi:proteasome accessory factor C|uniref:Protein pafC n=1 Tax=Mycobacteroides chelonae TaxID=1774 RepID=A0A1S1M0Q8_MYCCH|nr:YafY family protein [Mycobacteroides chelonae]OHU29231.1 protein pafC [Mycobacteroides chelonae]OHU77191.1 protein pafC [Mycobacteroides chelonae]QQG87674.1 YafY family transcriptional regulator [Mycobacteroides chelonae]QQG92490.1 YafY family transcriptional regulator [Mycobacteroides chelonae]
MTELSNRLTRLLNMVPYFQANPGISAADAAADLGVTTKQLMADLNQLWMCGLPGYGPGDLIDLSFSEESIEVTFSAGIDRPLRLTSPEATALLVALRALLDMPGTVDPEAARSAIAKIEDAAGAGDETLGRRESTTESDASSATPVESAAVSAVRAAVRNRKALRIEYYSASRDALSERIVDPIRIAVVGEHSYLEAWCRASEGVRLFRFDRIEQAEVLDQRSAPPAPAVQTATDTGLFEADPSLPAATVLVGPSASWVFDYFPMRPTGAQHADGSVEAAMTYASEDWMARLILGFGSAIRVLAPESLARRVRTDAVAALAAYQAS